MAKELLINKNNNIGHDKLLYIMVALTLTCLVEILSHTHGTVCWIAEPLSKLEGQLWTLSESILSEKEIKLCTIIHDKICLTVIHTVVSLILKDINFCG